MRKFTLVKVSTNWKRSKLESGDTLHAAKVIGREVRVVTHKGFRKLHTLEIEGDNRPPMRFDYMTQQEIADYAVGRVVGLVSASEPETGDLLPAHVEQHHIAAAAPEPQEVGSAW